MSAPINQVERRAIERHGAAALRAVAGEPAAAFIDQRVTIAGKPVRIGVPYRPRDHSALPLDQHRGIADAAAVRLRYSDLTLHRSMRPDDQLGQILFDTLEQLRCEAMVPESQPGVRANIGVAFERWDLATRGGGVSDSTMGRLLYTTIHMARSRLGSSVARLDIEQQQEIEAITEAARAELAPVIGHDLVAMGKAVDDQRVYATHALAVIEQVLGAFAPADDASVRADTDEARLLIAAAWDDDTGTPEEGEAALDDDSGAFGAADYQIFTTEFDREVSANELVLPALQERHRTRLDQMVAAQAVSAPRLARQLVQRLAVSSERGWRSGWTDGSIDPTRLGQVVASPGFEEAFRRPRREPVADVAVTFVLDNSGSMKAHRYEALAVLVDTYCRALDLAGATSEVLGFSTNSWSGGQAKDQWRAADSPANPGRIGDSLRIIYKDADHSWRRSRRSLASMLSIGHYRESHDGEALLWAYKRLLGSTAQRKVLVFVSDGAPSDAATAKANHEAYLTDHLRAVGAAIALDRRVIFGGMGVGHDMGWLLENSVSVDLSGTLTLGTYRALEDLIAGS